MYKCFITNHMEARGVEPLSLVPRNLIKISFDNLSLQISAEWMGHESAERSRGQSPLAAEACLYTLLAASAVT
jgi:hypothetical protein